MYSQQCRRMQCTCRTVQNRKNNKTGFVGVRKSGKKYQARLVLHNTEHNLGSFNTISEAVLARNEYITKHNLGEYKIQEIKNG